MDGHPLAHEKVTEPVNFDIGNHATLRHLRIDLTHAPDALRRLDVVASFPAARPPRPTSTSSPGFDEARMPLRQMQTEHIGFDRKRRDRLRPA